MGAPADAGDDGAPLDSGEDADASAGVVAVPLSGCSAFSYLAPTRIGASQTFQLILDTGSTTLAVASSACGDCAGITPLYTPGVGATDRHETASSVYGGYPDGGGPGWSGEIYEDTVSLGGTKAAAASMTFAAIDMQNQFFTPAACGSSMPPWQGIVGFAPTADAITGTDRYLDRLAAGGAVSDVFALQLCEPGGLLWLGGYDPAHVTSPPQYTPLSTSMLSKGAFVVDLESVAVAGGSPSPVHTGPYTETLVDSGSNQFFLPPATFSAVTAAIEATPAFRALLGADAGPSFFSGASCAELTQTKAQIDAALPPLTLVFGTNPAISVVAVATESYLVPVGGGSWCTGMVANAPDPSFPFVADLGSPILRSSVVVFDRVKGRLGFAPHTPCP